MLVPLVVFVSIVCGVIAISDPIKMGRVAIKSFTLYISTMAIGTVIALFMSLVVFNPGSGLSLNLSGLSGSKNFLSSMGSIGSSDMKLIDLFVSLIPANIITAFAEGNLLQIITFSIMVGVAINLIGEPAKPVARLFDSSSLVIFKVLNIIMSFAPIGVFALMALVVGTQGTDMLIALLGLIALIYFCMFIVIGGVYTAALAFIARLSPIPFFKKMFEVQLLAFSTTSSVATLPLNLKIAEKKLGINKSIANFVLPLGSTVNMNGLSTYMGIIAVFAANLYGIQLSFLDILTIIITSTLAAIGSAGVPAAGIVVLPMVLSSVGIPLDVIGLMVAINRVVDMISTTTNITGDTLTAVLVAKSEGELDEKIYYADSSQLLHAIPKTHDIEDKISGQKDLEILTS